MSPLLFSKSDINQDNNVDIIKKKFAAIYISFMWFVHIFYLLYYYYVLNIEISFTNLYIIILWGIVSNVLILFGARFNIKYLVAIFLTIVPLCFSYTILSYWNVSQISLVWLLPLPFGAAVFFSRRVFIFFMAYSIALIVLIYILSFYISLVPQITDREVIEKLDTINVIINIIILLICFIYYDKIKTASAQQSIISTMASLDDSYTSKETCSTIEINHAKLDGLYLHIEDLVVNQLLLKDEDLTINYIGTKAKTNTKYISLALKKQGFKSFNDYLNIHRINYVKKLIAENDLNKVTLQYIYEAAGFSSQTTFNRVFKKVKGCTPSDYIKNKKIRA